jgi:hypothetical protein
MGKPLKAAAITWAEFWVGLIGLLLAAPHWVEVILL